MPLKLRVDTRRMYRHAAQFLVWQNGCEISTFARMVDSPILRLATPTDVEAINDIYNFYVLHSTCTYQDEPETLAGRQAWFAAHGPEHPVIVAQLDQAVVGWGSLSRFHARSAYRHTVENAVYVRRGFERRGIGRLLLNDLIDRASAIDHHSIIALISAEQIASVALHEQLGFTHVGRLCEVGRKFDQWLDVIYMQKRLRTQSE